MRIATFNANSVRARLEIILNWLQAQEPDVLALQETKVQDEDFPHDSFEEAGYHVAFSGEKSYNGVAVLTREKPLRVIAGFSDDGPADAARLLRVDLPGLFLVNTYVPQGRSLDDQMYAYKQEWFRRLRSYFAKAFTPADPVIWLGDMNVARTDLDVFSPEKHLENVCFTPEIRRCLDEVIGWGFVDVFRRAHPDERLYSFFDYRAPWALKRRDGWRIDAIYATQPLALRCRRAEIDLQPRLGPRPSDHTFLVADFD